MNRHKRNIHHLVFSILLAFVFCLHALGQPAMAAGYDQAGSLSVKKVVTPNNSVMSNQKYVFDVRLTRPKDCTVTYTSEDISATSHVDTVPVNTTYAIKSGAEIGFDRSDHELSSWNTKADGSGKSYAPGTTLTVTENIVLYAQWTYRGPSYSVQYFANGGTGSHADQSLKPNSSYTVKANADIGISRADYTLAGWNTEPDGSGTAYQPGDSITLTDNLSLYAQWQFSGLPAIVSYFGNGGTGSFADLGLTPGESYTIKDPADIGFSRADYTFTGWNTSVVGTGQAYQPGDTFILAGSFMLFAQWEYSGAVYHSVTYESNNGGGNHADTGITQGASYTVKDPGDVGFSNVDYTFTGWNTKADGTGTTYSPGDSLDVNSDMTLYAQWEPNLNVFNGMDTRLLASADAPEQTATAATEPYSIPDFDSVRVSLATQGISITETGAGTYRIILGHNQKVSMPHIENGVAYTITEVGTLDDNGNLVPLRAGTVNISVSGRGYRISGATVTGTITGAVAVEYENRYAVKEEHVVPATGEKAGWHLYGMIALIAFAIMAQWAARIRKPER